MKQFRKYLSAAVVLAALALPTGIFAQPQDQDDKRPVMAESERDEHPVILEAIHKLEQVKYDLEHKAAHDFRGHRVEAIKAIDQAIAHLNEALRADPR